MDYALWYRNPYDVEATFMEVEAKPREMRAAALHSF